MVHDFMYCKSPENYFFKLVSNLELLVELRCSGSGGFVVVEIVFGLDF